MDNHGAASIPSPLRSRSQREIGGESCLPDNARWRRLKILGPGHRFSRPRKNTHSTFSTTGPKALDLGTFQQITCFMEVRTILKVKNNLKYLENARMFQETTATGPCMNPCSSKDFQTEGQEVPEELITLHGRLGRRIATATTAECLATARTFVAKPDADPTPLIGTGHGHAPIPSASTRP